MTRRNPDRYTAQDWREAGPTVGAIIANCWLVYTECELGDLRAVIPAKEGTRCQSESLRQRRRDSLF